VGEPLNVGIVGCGTISGAYLTTLAQLGTVTVVAVADLDRSRAESVARSHSGVRAVGVDDLMSDSTVELVLNLTVPAAHAEIALQAIAASKSVYGEKPLAATIFDARLILDRAKAAGVKVGCAPDTVLGTGLQTARKAIDGGRIGTPVAATASFATGGHESWHPNPDFYYAPGGGPLFDMGPYYITALVIMLGPVVSVVGAASRQRSTRTIRSGPRQGQEIPVSIDTHVAGILTHRSGALTTLSMSFDSVASQSPPIEIHGEFGSLVVPDPNRFDGQPMLRTTAMSQWEALPVSAGYIGASRGYGIHDLATSAPGAEPRAGGTLAFHVLDIMESLLRSAHEGKALAIHSTCDRPAPVPLQTLANVRR
jgi:predicted dehydrogenase